MTEVRYPFRVAPQVEVEGWSVWFPDLPGCRGWALTLEDVGKEAATVLAAWIEAEVRLGHPLPEPSDDGAYEGWADGAEKVEPLPAPEYIGVREVAAALGVGVRRVHQLADNRGVGRLIGGVRLFLPTEIEAMRPNAVGRPRKSIATAAMSH
jgi:predicted RNase H-like HicB family nuclease